MRIMEQCARCSNAFLRANLDMASAYQRMSCPSRNDINQTRRLIKHPLWAKSTSKKPIFMRGSVFLPSCGALLLHSLTASSYSTLLLHFLTVNSYSTLLLHSLTARSYSTLLLHFLTVHSYLHALTALSYCTLLSTTTCNCNFGRYHYLSDFPGCVLVWR